jgi:CDP-glycerol glycerophosphotransferase (TagB/SpsB family)
MKKQKILITVGEDIIARNIIFTDFWNEFRLGTKDCDILLVVHEDRLGFFKDKFAGDDGVGVVSFKHAQGGKMDNLILSIARSGLNTHTNLWSKMRSYNRGDSGFIDTWVKRCLTFVFGSSSLFKRLIRWCILALPADRGALRIFQDNNVDVFIPLSLTNFNFDVPLARASRKLGVPIIGMVRSWDNFSSHGVLRVVPDVLLLQNEFLKEMAIKYQNIYENEVPMKIVGIPHYDEVVNLSQVLDTRDVFLSKIGLNPDQKYILYGAMGSFLFMHEDELIPIFNDILEKKSINVHKILYRAHPKFKSIKEENVFRNVLIDTKGDYIVGGEAIDGKSNKYLINSIYHSELVITGASSMAIDAVVLDKPVVCVAFDGSTDEKKIDYYDSVRRFYDLYTHFEGLVDCDGVKIAYDKQEMIDYANKYMEDSSIDKDGRERIRSKFAYKVDGHSSKRLADSIINELNKHDQRL